MTPAKMCPRLNGFVQTCIQGLPTQSIIIAYLIGGIGESLLGAMVKTLITHEVADSKLTTITLRGAKIRSSPMHPQHLSI